MTAQTTLVLGGTGKTGRRIVEQLTARKVPVRIGSRSATPSFDWENRSTWPAALANVDAVYISYYPDLAAPGATDAIRASRSLRCAAACDVSCCCPAAASPRRSDAKRSS